MKDLLLKFVTVLCLRINAAKSCASLSVIIGGALPSLGLAHTSGFLPQR